MVTPDWTDNEKVKLLTRAEVKELVEQDQWPKLGEVFGFEPVYLFEGKRFVDWRCVPESLLAILREKVEAPAGDVRSMNRVQKRKHLRSLMLRGKWEAVARNYGFRPRFSPMPNGKHVIDWSCVPWQVHDILRCGDGIKKTLYTQEGGVYDPLQKGPRPPQPVLVPRDLRHARLSLTERLPLRYRLYEAQKGLCYFCHQFTMPNHWSLEHLTPISRGGTNEESNLRGACGDCNSNKSSFTEEEFLQSEFLKNKLKNEK